MLKLFRVVAERAGVEPYLVKALWRAGLKLVVGLGVIGALVGLRISAAAPRGIEADLAELETLSAQIEAEKTAGMATGGVANAATAANGEVGEATAEGGEAPAVDTTDRDRLVRCRIDGSLQYTRAGDCEMRAGHLEEIPPPAPDSDPAATAQAPTAATQPPAAPAN